MAEFNARGEAVDGLGEHWLADDLRIRQHCNDIKPGCVVATSPGDAVVFDGPSGAIAANRGGVWAAWVVRDGVAGVLDSLGRWFPGAGLADPRDGQGGGASPDGAYAIKAVRDSLGGWDAIERDSRRWRLTDGDARNIQLVGGGEGLWIERSTLCTTIGLSTLKTPAGQWGWPSAVQIDGRWELLYQSYTGGALVLAGRVVARGTAFWRPAAIQIDGVIRVRWNTDEGSAATQIEFTPAEFAALPLLSLAPVVQPPTVPPTVPPAHPPLPPEPPNMNYSLPQNVKGIIDRYVSVYPVPKWRGVGSEDHDPATGGASGVFEDKCRVWTRGLGEQIRYETDDPNWGLKNAGGGRPQSKDSIAHLDGGRLINFDMLSGVGTGTPSLIAEPSGADITGQVFMPVSPVNHLGATVPPVPSEPPAPPPGTPDLSDILRRLDAAEKRIAELEHAEADVLDQVHQLDATTVKVGQVPDLSNVAHFGDRVEVSGKLSVFGLNKWGGTIVKPEAK